MELPNHTPLSSPCPPWPPCPCSPHACSPPHRTPSFPLVFPPNSPPIRHCPPSLPLVPLPASLPATAVTALRVSRRHFRPRAQRRCRVRGGGGGRNAADDAAAATAVAGAAAVGAGGIGGGAGGIGGGDIWWRPRLALTLTPSGRRHVLQWQPAPLKPKRRADPRLAAAESQRPTQGSADVT
ncbi:unnamed protein product [Closterium sp. NIES-54]